jgi:hypothetical protein
MTQKHPFLVRVPFGAACGCVLGLVLANSSSISPSVSDALGAPAIWAFEQWHQLGLPPQGEGALAGPYFAFIIQWTVIGAIVGACLSWERARHDRAS